MPEHQEPVPEEAPLEAETQEPEGTEPSSETAEDELPADIESLTAALKEARSKAEENWELILRAKADLDNQVRRHQAELEKAHKFALEGFVKELLQVWDSLELGINAAREESADVESLREGGELTLKLLADVLNKFGVEQVDPQGEPFDPEQHQAMSMQPREDVPPNTVVAVVQKGYLLNGRLMRPAMVMVSQAAS